MLHRSPRPCSEPGCPNLATGKGSRCDECTTAYSRRRGSSAARGYGSRWRRVSKAWLNDPKHPERRHCALAFPSTCTGVATMVDHVKPHKGNRDLFWDRANWQPSCVPCNSRKGITTDQQG